MKQLPLDGLLHTSSIGELSYHATVTSPKSMQHAFSSSVTGRKSYKTLRNQPEAVWPPSIEVALFDALKTYRPASRPSSKRLRRFPKRNKFIADYISKVTGTQRTPKQVGSRLQQLRDSCTDEGILRLLTCRDFAEDPQNESTDDTASSSSSNSSSALVTPTTSSGSLPPLATTPASSSGSPVMTPLAPSSKHLPSVSPLVSSWRVGHITHSHTDSADGDATMAVNTIPSSQSHDSACGIIPSLRLHVDGHPLLENLDADSQHPLRPTSNIPELVEGPQLPPDFPETEGIPILSALNDGRSTPNDSEEISHILDTLTSNPAYQLDFSEFDSPNLSTLLAQLPLENPFYNSMCLPLDSRNHHSNNNRPTFPLLPPYPNWNGCQNLNSIYPHPEHPLTYTMAESQDSGTAHHNYHQGIKSTIGPCPGFNTNSHSSVETESPLNILPISNNTTFTKSNNGSSSRTTGVQHSTHASPHPSPGPCPQLGLGLKFESYGLGYQYFGLRTTTTRHERGQDGENGEWAMMLVCQRRQLAILQVRSITGMGAGLLEKEGHGYGYPPIVHHGRELYGLGLPGFCVFLFGSGSLVGSRAWEGCASRW